MGEDMAAAQWEVCDRFGAVLARVGGAHKLGVSRGVLTGGVPTNGVRLSPERGTCGWYIWDGEEFSTDPDFFVVLHVSHLVERRPDIAPYLGLPPGWRFLLAPSYKDVWFDEAVAVTG